MIFDYALRLKRLKAKLKESDLGALLITNETNVRYLTGFKGEDSLVLVTTDSQFFLTDSRYTEDAKDTIKGFTIIEVGISTYDSLKEIIKNNRIRKVGFDSLNLPYGITKRLAEHIRPARLVPTGNIIERLRAVKDQSEIKIIRESIKLTKKVLDRAVRKIRPGISERSISEFIECEFIHNGARIAFDTIAACGKNCSKPHAHATMDKVKNNSSIMIDMGCKLDFYNSDITRMIFLGKVKDKIKEIYGIVSSAQKYAIEKIKPGTKISDIDRAGRGYIESKGYGKFFGHSLGHGIGMDVHEEPSISGKNNNELEAGMVFTVEPAIYLPKMGGVRIEDMVLVTRSGCEVLTI